MPPKKKAKNKEQSNLAAFNIKPKYPPHADNALVRAKVCSAVCMCPFLLQWTIDLVRSGFIVLGVQKLAHIRTLSKMTTAACHASLTVDGIEPKDAGKLKTLNFDRYPDLSFPCPLCAEGCKPAGMLICCPHDLILSVTLRMFFNLPWIAISLLTFLFFCSWADFHYMMQCGLSLKPGTDEILGHSDDDIEIDNSAACSCREGDPGGHVALLISGFFCGTV